MPTQDAQARTGTHRDWTGDLLHVLLVRYKAGSQRGHFVTSPPPLRLKEKNMVSYFSKKKIISNFRQIYVTRALRFQKGLAAEKRSLDDIVYKNKLEEMPMKKYLFNFHYKTDTVVTPMCL